MSRIEKYNTFFSACDERISLLSQFREVDFGAMGEIAVSTVKEQLNFQVWIPKSFPLGYSTSSIRFLCTSLIGFEHQNNDKTICLHPKPDLDIDRKLKQEINLLFDWIQKYYVEENLDPDYVYLQHDKEPFCVFFDSKESSLEKGNYGYFDYVEFATASRNKSFLALNIGNIKSSFSQYYFERQIKKGAWIYIEDEPVLRNRMIARNWNDLSAYVSEEQIGFLYSAIKEIKTESDYFFTMVGYKIPSRFGEEI
ncbi:MAG: hypothetical protein IH571_03540, partial [Acholeplasmataceae bacterium]|nr:hypothetical protein [Acholeplasmataceae bacterium]